MHKTHTLVHRNTGVKLKTQHGNLQQQVFVARVVVVERFAKQQHHRATSQANLALSLQKYPIGYRATFKLLSTILFISVFVYI